MFFVPPKLPPLDLELAEFRLYSSFPSVGEGLTTDGRPIETGYRGGWLTVWLGEPGDASARPVRPTTAPACAPIIDTRIGASRDGNISCEQLFQVLGLRMSTLATAVDAERVPSPTDFSGNTLYWDGGSIYSVSGDFRSLMDRLKARHPKLHLIEDAFDFDLERNQLRSHLWLPADTIEAQRRYFVIQTDAPITRAVPAGSFPIAASISLSIPALPLSKIFRSHPDAEIMPMTWASIGGRCRTDDPDGRSFLEAFIASLDAICFTLHGRIDLETGERLSSEASHCWYTPEAAAWCEAASNRFISVRREGDGSARRFIGYRPARQG